MNKGRRYIIQMPKTYFRLRHRSDYNQRFSGISIGPFEQDHLKGQELLEPSKFLQRHGQRRVGDPETSTVGAFDADDDACPVRPVLLTGLPIVQLLQGIRGRLGKQYRSLCLWCPQSPFDTRAVWDVTEFERCCRSRLVMGPRASIS